MLSGGKCDQHTPDWKDGKLWCIKWMMHWFEPGQVQFKLHKSNIFPFIILVNTQGFVWKFFMHYIYFFIHSFIIWLPSFFPIFFSELSFCRLDVEHYDEITKFFSPSFLGLTKRHLIFRIVLMTKHSSSHVYPWMLTVWEWCCFRVLPRVLIVWGWRF